MDMVSAVFPGYWVLGVEAFIKKPEMCVRPQDTDEMANEANAEYKLRSTAASMTNE